MIELDCNLKNIGQFYFNSTFVSWKNHFNLIAILFV